MISHRTAAAPTLLLIAFLTLSLREVAAGQTFFTTRAQSSPRLLSLNQTPQAPADNSEGDSIVVLEKKNALGLDILVSNSGFGLGAFYRRQYTEDLYGFGTFSFSEAKDDREVEQYDIITGQTFVPGKVNRFLLVPLIFGVQRRMFREDIADNFRPYVTAALGPTLVYSAPYDREFFNSLGHGQAHYTLGGYVGFGAFFGFDPSNLVGLSFRYYFVPLKNQIESLEGIYKKQFGGFFITLNVGTIY